MLTARQPPAILNPNPLVLLLLVYTSFSPVLLLLQSFRLYGRETQRNNDVVDLILFTNIQLQFNWITFANLLG